MQHVLQQQLAQCAAQATGQRAGISPRCALLHPLQHQRAFGSSRLRQQQQQQQQQNVRHQRGLQAVTVAASSDAAASSSGSGSSSKADAGGRQTYKPSSFKELVNDAVSAMTVAMGEGMTRMEVEFPVLPGQDVRYKGSSDAFIDASVQLALAGARGLHDATGKKVHILVPDETEYLRSAKMFKASLELSPGVTLGYLGDTTGKSTLMGSFSRLFQGGAPAGLPDPAEASAAADVFFAINASTIELSDIERYAADAVGPSRALVLWCLELDTLRADLGLLGFPPKDLQFRFLSQFRPVFYIRQRDYSKTVAVAPFIINYSGILFREYPGPWQAMLRQDNGVYACVAESRARYTLSDFKEGLMGAMGLKEGEDETARFLRTGYKTSTWWEDGVGEASTAWRT